MPEYLAPGVYVEETSFRSKSIEGVSTSTAAFVGPTRRGPTTGVPELTTSYADFQRTYGGFGRLAFDGSAAVPNYLALAVQAFFQNGGRRLYVRRIFQANGGDTGLASASIATGPAPIIDIVSRFPGACANGTVTFTERRQAVSGTVFASLPAGTVVLHGIAPGAIALRTATGWEDSTGAAVTPTSGEVLTLTFEGTDLDGNVQVEEGMGMHASHPRYVGSVLAAAPPSLDAARNSLFALAIDAANAWHDLRTALGGDTVKSFTLTTGDDGIEPLAASYTTALTDLEPLADVSIVAAPGHSSFTVGAAIRTALLTHVETAGLYRLAVLDSAPGDTVASITTTRGTMDSDHAALYFPWVTISNPLAAAGSVLEPLEINVPPSGFLAGIYARNDAENGVWKAPANEIVRGALRFEREISFGENEALNPLGVNCLRFFPGRGYRVWGARTASSDPEWKYLSVRRYFNYLEASIERGTQWAVFESNGPALWSNVTDTIESFLYNEWRSGALLGSTTKQAYFVRCDRSTMTQNDLDNGRLICLIGVAVVKPAEFVIFRIGQKTADARD